MPNTSLSGTHQRPSKLSIAAVIWLSMVAALVANIQPMFLGALAQTYGLSGQQLGVIGGLEMLGTCIASLSAFYWFPKFSSRRVAFWALLMAMAGNLLTAELVEFEHLLAARFFTGLFGAGVLYALTLGLIGQMGSPDRVIAIAILLQVLSQAVGMGTVPMLMNTWELPGVTGAIALLFATGLLLLRVVPLQKVSVTPAANHQAVKSLLPLGLLISLILFSVGLGGLWAFMERIGTVAQFTQESIGGALAVAVLIGGAGALAAAFIGSRLGRTMPIAASLVLQLLACFLFATRSDWYSYVAAIAIFSFAWNLCLPFLMGAIATADASGRFMVLIPAAQAGGYAVGPLLVALFLMGDRYTVAAWISMSVFVLCAALVLPLLRRLARQPERNYVLAE